MIFKISSMFSITLKVFMTFGEVLSGGVSDVVFHGLQPPYHARSDVSWPNIFEAYYRENLVVSSV
jgi:hypothetical protein